MKSILNIFYLGMMLFFMVSCTEKTIEQPGKSAIITSNYVSIQIDKTSIYEIFGEAYNEEVSRVTKLINNEYYREVTIQTAKNAAKKLKIDSTKNTYYKQEGDFIFAQGFYYGLNYSDPVRIFKFGAVKNELWMDTVTPVSKQTDTTTATEPGDATTEPTDTTTPSQEDNTTKTYVTRFYGKLEEPKTVSDIEYNDVIHFEIRVFKGTDTLNIPIQTYESFYAREKGLIELSYATETPMVILKSTTFDSN